MIIRQGSRFASRPGVSSGDRVDCGGVSLNGDHLLPPTLTTNLRYCGALVRLYSAWTYLVIGE